jgi:hypothetical protein
MNFIVLLKLYLKETSDGEIKQRIWQRKDNEDFQKWGSLRHTHNLNDSCDNITCCSVI